MYVKNMPTLQVVHQVLQCCSKNNLLYGDHSIFGYVTVLNQKLYLESCLCVLVNITLLLYTETSKIVILR